MRHRPSVSLFLSRLDDRLTPSNSGPASLSLPYPEYWTESKFLPTQSTPAADGGTWVIGTTQTAGRYSWWGNYNADWAVVKLTAAGTIDPAFNGGKVKDLDSGLLDWFSFQDLQAGPDGSLYALARNVTHDAWLAATGAAPAGLTPPPRGPDEDFAVVRFLTDGSLDPSFDGDGAALFDLDPRTGRNAWDNGGQAVFAVGPGGTVTVAAVRNEFIPDADGITVDVIRLTASGAADATFDGDGRASLDVSVAGTLVPPSGQLVGIGVAADGSVTVGGSWNAYPYFIYASGGPDYTGLFAARLTAGGSADGTFDGDGVATFKDSVTGDNSGLNVNDFAVGADGLYFVGTKNPSWSPLATYPYPQTSEAVVIRLTGTGQLDAAFDGDGVAVPNFGDGRLVTGGFRIAPLPGGGVAFGGQDMIPPPVIAGDVTVPIFVSAAVIGKLKTDGTTDAGFAPIRPGVSGYGSPADLDALADGGLTAVLDYPARLIATDADGGTFTTIPVPYDRRGPWQPPPDFVPFPWQPVCRTDTGDLNGDGVTDYVFVTGAGTSSGVRVVDGQTGADLISNFMPYEPGFRGGMFVVVADFDGDGHDDLVVSPDEGGSARVQVFTFEGGAFVQQANYFAIEDPNFRGGGSIAVSDVNGDGTPDLLVGAARGGSQRIATFDGKTLFGRHSLPPVLNGDYFAPLPGVDPATYRGGVILRTQDVNGDGHDDVIMAPADDETNAVVLFHGTSDGRTFRYRTTATASFGPSPSSGGLFEYEIAGNVSRNLS